MEAIGEGDLRMSDSGGGVVGQVTESTKLQTSALAADVLSDNSRPEAREEVCAPGHGVTMPPWPRVSVVMPTLNEAKNLPHVMAKLPHRLHEVIVVDGFSTDDTVDVARVLRPTAKIVLQTRPGKGEALRRGFEAATGDIIVMLDADGSADPEEIPAFVEALLDGVDFAKGSRFRGGGGSDDLTRLRRVGNFGLNCAVNVLFRTSYSDLCYGYNAFWRSCLDVMCIDCTGFEVETMINIRIARAGLITREVASFESKRIHGQSNLRTFRDGGRVLRTILRERLRRAPGTSQPPARTAATAASELTELAVAPENT
jgi:glycosyltransferase involved in cell wall biosynthesis